MHYRHGLFMLGEIHNTAWHLDGRQSVGKVVLVQFLNERQRAVQRQPLGRSWVVVLDSGAARVNQ